jgi:hypothetical protein
VSLYLPRTEEENRWSEQKATASPIAQPSLINHHLLRSHHSCAIAHPDITIRSLSPYHFFAQPSLIAQPSPIMLSPRITLLRMRNIFSIFLVEIQRRK